MSVPQHMQALRLANHVRLQRARICGDLRKPPRADAMRACAELLLDPPDELAGMRVSALLTTCHRVGRGLMLRVLVPLRIGELRTVGELTERQRHLLAKWLLDQAGGGE